VADRVRARVRGAALDRELARGVPQDASPAHALRARLLTRPSVARQLGDQLRRIIGQAYEPAGRSARVRPSRERVVAVQDDLRFLASRLQSPLPARAPGIAKVRLLLSDGSGPLYYRDSAEDLATAVREAKSALG
jgi:hypothetical protein